MSRELLKQCAAALDPFDNKVLLKAIETELAKPEPEPVAWVGIGLMPVSSEDMVRMKTYEPGTANLYDTPLYTTPPDQSARIAELECEIQSLREAYCGAMGDKRMYKKRCQPYEHVMRRSQICGDPDFCIKCGKEELNDE